MRLFHADSEGCIYPRDAIEPELTARPRRPIFELLRDLSQVAVLPARSVAVTLTVVVPTGNVEPDGGTATTDTVPGH